MKDQIQYDMNDVFSAEMETRMGILGRLKNLVRNIRSNWLTMIVMLVLWLVPGVLVHFGIEASFLKPLHFLTAGYSGLTSSSLFQIAGGAFSRGIVLSWILSFVIPVIRKIGKKEKFLNFTFLSLYFKKFKSLFTSGLRGLACLLIGLGIAFLLHGFLSTDGSLINGFSSVIGGFYAMSLMGRSKGFLGKVFKKIKLQEDMVMLGLASGLVLALPFSARTTGASASYWLGAIVLVLGVLLLFLGKKRRNSVKKVAATVTLIAISLAMFPMDALAVDQEVGVVIEVPEFSYCYEPFELKIKISDERIKKGITKIALTNWDENFKILSEPEYDTEGRNYSGQDEVTFVLQAVKPGAETRKTDILIYFIDRHLVDEDLGFAEGTFLIINQPITQVTSEFKMELPSGYSFTSEGYKPYVNYPYSRHEVPMLNADHPSIAYNERFEIQSTPGGWDGYSDEDQEILREDFSDYVQSVLPNNSDLEGLPSQDVPKNILDNYGAEAGSYVVFKDSEGSGQLEDGSYEFYSSEVIMYMTLLKDDSVIKLRADYSGGVWEAPANALNDAIEKQIMDAFASISIVPVVEGVVAYDYLVELNEFREETQENIVTENVVVANEEKADGPPVTPDDKAAIPIALASGMFAVAAAGLASASGEEGKKDKRRKEYKLVISKSVGSKIKSEKQVTFYAGIYEKIYEEDGTVSEGMNGTLSSMIQISSPDAFVEISESTMMDDVKAVNFMARADKEGKALAPDCSIICKVNGPSGAHTQEMIFEIVGDPYISFSSDKLYILASSKKEYRFPYQIVDFLENPTSIEMKCMQAETPFTLQVDPKKGSNTLLIKEAFKGEKFEEFFTSYTCEIIGKNKDESSRDLVDIVVCHEGILPDFLGKPKEIRGYKKSLESEEMEETTFGIKASIWNEQESMLEVKAPEQVEVLLEDEKGIFELIGVEIEPDDSYTDKRASYYKAKAKINFPSEETIDGKMILKGSLDTRNYTNETEIELVPDVLAYYDALDKEYQACKRVIEVYMAERFRKRKLMELEKAKGTLGLEDFRLFRKGCWLIAQHSIEEEEREYLIEAAWYDEAIATAELVVYIGDIAFELALAPLGGPIAGFMASQVKSGLLDFYTMYVKSENKSTWDLTQEFVMKRIEQTLGSADGLIQMPKASEKKKLIAWLSSYVIYRIGYHWYFDKDKNQNPIGISESIQRGFMDFVGKGAGALLGNYLNNCGKGRWVEDVSIADGDQKLVNDNVAKAAKEGLDLLDSAADKADEVIDDIVKMLVGYIDSLRG
jgi:hypothetical protein